jgi:hypothetical protein
MNHEMYALIDHSSTFTVRQHIKVLPKSCCKMPPCVRQENTYSIYVGNTKHAQSEIMRADEISDDWNRCCCAPYHPFKLEFRQYIPMPGDGAETDYSHIRNDIKDDWMKYSKIDKYQYMKDLYKNQPVLFTIERDDGQRCCCRYFYRDPNSSSTGFPCKCLSEYVCMSSCQDGVHVYLGQTRDYDKEVGRPFFPDTNKQIGELVMHALTE